MAAENNKNNAKVCINFKKKFV